MAKKEDELLRSIEELRTEVRELREVVNMLVDIIKWTGGEEAYSGETISEKDKLIEHTKSQDAKWFYGTMVGAPLLMLGLGFLVVTRRRRKHAGGES